MHAWSWIFCAALAVSTGAHVWLARRQKRAVMEHRAEVPAPFRDRIGLAAHRKAADYTSAKLDLEIADGLVSAALVLAWTLGGGLALLDELWRRPEWSALLTGTAVMLSAFLLMALLDLPVAAYRTFVIEQRFGFNHTTPALFLADAAKQGAVALLLGAPLIALILWLMTQAGALWWLYAWLAWMAFTFLMVWAYPTLVAPLFNTFSPLRDEALQARIEHLLQRCGFHSKGVFVMDGSKRSGHGNAYFTGLGARKRIVFFDTLLTSLSAPEMEAVLAHELGHFRRGHVRKRLFLNAALSLAGFALLGALATQTWFYTELGVTHPSAHMALLLFLLATPPFTAAMQPLMSRWMRKHEFEADDFAARHASAADLIQALVKLYEDNAATLTPDPLYSAYHDTHPSAPVRIQYLSAKLGLNTRTRNPEDSC